MRAWLLLLAACGVRENGSDVGNGFPTDPKLKGDGAIAMLGDQDAGEDTGVPGCEGIPPYDAGPRSLTQPCGAHRCNPDVQFCEITAPGVMGGAAVYQCRQAPKECRSNVTCACLKPCLGGNECEDGDGGAYVPVL